MKNIVWYSNPSDLKPLKSEISFFRSTYFFV